VSDAILVLEDGRTFHGEAYGATGTTVGEAVFSTGMTGYQETLTDPSYAGQIVAMTAPHIGNTGVNGEDDESRRMWVAGFIVRDPARRPANWRATGSLDDELVAQGVVGISGIDTRALTRHLRDRGAMRAGISTELGADELLARVTDSPSMTGADLAPSVSAAEPYVVPAVGEKRFTIAALDLGIKTATPRYLAELGVETHVLPATATAEQLLEHGVDGVFVSNGPGDPAAADYAVAAVRCSASASATRSSAARWGWAPTSCASGTAASTSRFWTGSAAPCGSPATTTASRSTRRWTGRWTPRSARSRSVMWASTTRSSRVCG
jgi:carbamoyl-phosphate synthase small subunit